MNANEPARVRSEDRKRRPEGDTLGALPMRKRALAVWGAMWVGLTLAFEFLAPAGHQSFFSSSGQWRRMFNVRLPISGSTGRTMMKRCASPAAS